MKNKFTLCACALAMVAALLTSCKDKTDIFAIESKIAQNNFPGFYYCLAIDKENVSTTIYEWYLEDKNGAKTGYYRVASTGNMQDSDVKKNLTWSEATMADDKLSMIIPVVVEGEAMNLTWSDGVISVAGYTTEKYPISVADVMRTVHETFANYDFVYNDTTNYVTSRMDTIPYLAWKTEVVYYTETQIDSAKQALIVFADTLAWFNATYPNRAVPDTVRFSTKEQPDGTYKGLVPVPYEDNEIVEVKTIHGPLHIINSEIVFATATNGATSGSFVYHEQTWTEECYTDPTSEKAIYEDYMSDLSNAKWTFSAFTNVKKFNTVFKGDWDMTLNYTKGGVPQTPTEMHEKDYFLELQFSNYSKSDGTILMDDHKYTAK